MRGPLAAVAVLVACTGTGAALAAATHRAPPARVRAESILTVSVPSPEFQAVAWHTVGQVIKLPAVRAEIAQAGGVEPSSLRVGALGDPRSSLITIYADGTDTTQAELLAGAAVSVALNFLRQNVYPSAVTSSTFDESSEGWDLGGGIFVVPPTQLQQTHDVGHARPGALTVRCPAAGCGPYLVLNRTFRRDDIYAAAGWVKAAPNTRLRIVLGSSAQDVVVGPTVTGTTRWMRLFVVWSPTDDAGSAVVTFQVMSPRPSPFSIDDVQVGSRAAIRKGARPQRAAQYRSITRPALAGTLGAGDTASWAAGGAVGGLLVGTAGVAAGLAAARRRRRKADVGSRGSA
jgi:hypothetical protein